jgi:general secretion pathway protein A
MDYYSILNLNKEPFSNSPDPEFFFQSEQHVGCLQKLELSMRLRRGLNVVLGDVGTGKTTLCRQLIRKFAEDKAYETHLILDPQFTSPSELLTTVAEMFEGAQTSKAANDWQLKEMIKNYIFRRGVDENKTVILIIDEGQKIPEFCLEILREFLNFETNKFKLLQIVIFAQKEFGKTLKDHENFADRISLYHVLGPMNFRDTRAMIQFRLKQSSGESKVPVLFSSPALRAIYWSTRGYPRKIIHLCHRSILTMIIQNRTKVGWLLVRSSIRRAFPGQPKKWFRAATAAAFVGLVMVLLIAALAPERLEQLLVLKPKGLSIITAPVEPPKSEPEETQLPPNLADVQPAADQPAQEAVTTAALEPGLEKSADTGSDTDLKTGAETTDKVSDVEHNLPTQLGVIALERNESLWKLIQRVYGVVNSYYINSRYLPAVTAVNPHIVDPNYVEAGRPLSLPAIPAKVKPLPRKVWWVEVGERDTLKGAVGVLKEYSLEIPPLRLIPYWNHRQGLKFAIIFDEYFFDETSARKRRDQLAQDLDAEYKVLPKWDEDTVFYSDPFSRLVIKRKNNLARTRRN